MVKYQKLLDGFTDDELFKDMIPIVVHGSHTHSGNADTDIPEEYMKDEDKKMHQKMARKETKSAIPKLEDQDRQQVLPIIIKILQSKLVHKKGVVNKKSLFVRRNLIYQFFASLNPATEFRFVID